MSVPGGLFHPGEWARDGRGLTTKFPDLNAHLVRDALAPLWPRWPRLRWLLVSKVEEQKRFLDQVELLQESVPFDGHTLDDLAAAGRWNFFLWDPTLSPGLRDRLEAGFADSRAAATLSLSGLVGVQYRRTLKSQEQPTWVGCVNQVISVEGERVEHRAYEGLYRAIVRSLRSTAPPGPS